MTPIPEERAPEDGTPEGKMPDAAEPAHHSPGLPQMVWLAGLALLILAVLVIIGRHTFAS